MRAGGTVLAVGGTVFSGYAFSQDVAEGKWGSAALNGTGFVGEGFASRTLGAIGAAETAIVTTPVFVSIAVGKGIGRGAVWLWNKIF
jgi:hypothetical protein